LLANESPGKPITISYNSNALKHSAAFKKANRADFAIERKALDYIADDYSIVITEENIQALITAASVEEEANKLGAEKVFTADKQVKASRR
jgi:hypothetical protein